MALNSKSYLTEPHLDLSSLSESESSAHALKLGWVEASCPGLESSGNSATQICSYLGKYLFVTNKTGKFADITTTSFKL